MKPGRIQLEISDSDADDGILLGQKRIANLSYIENNLKR